MKGILDRIEDNNQAVILIEEIQETIIVPLEELPENSQENTYFHIEEKDGKYRVLSIDNEATEEAKEKSEDLLAKLRAKSSGSKYRRE